jgi:hypothetical protein
MDLSRDRLILELELLLLLSPFNTLPAPLVFILIHDTRRRREKIIFCHNDEESRFLGNVDKYLPDCTLLRLKIP